jgi:outer membrane immunogenic protein
MRRFNLKLSIVVMLLGLPGLALAQPAPGNSSGLNSSSASGWLAGAQAGYNWQSASVVYGIEADIAGLGLKHTMNTTLLGDIIPAPTASTTTNIDWYGTVRGRLGWTTGPVLFYGTGGFAYGGTRLNSTVFDPILPTSLNTQSSSVKTGWVAGAGIDYHWTRNLILNLSYQYVDLGKTSLSA